MPYVSDAQRKYFNANRSKMEAQGVDVDEYNEASKGMKLPARAPKVGVKKVKVKKVGVKKVGVKKVRPPRISYESPAAMMLGIKKTPEIPLLRS